MILFIKSKIASKALMSHLKTVSNNNFINHRHNRVFLIDYLCRSLILFVFYYKFNICNSVNGQQNNTISINFCYKYIAMSFSSRWSGGSCALFFLLIPFLCLFDNIVYLTDIRYCILSTILLTSPLA